MSGILGGFHIRAYIAHTDNSPGSERGVGGGGYRGSVAEQCTVRWAYSI